MHEEDRLIHWRDFFLTCNEDIERPSVEDAKVFDLKQYQNEIARFFAEELPGQLGWLERAHAVELLDFSGLLDKGLELRGANANDDQLSLSFGGGLYVTKTFSIGGLDIAGCAKVVEGWLADPTSAVEELESLEQG